MTRVLTQGDFDRFAALSRDDNPIHCDPVFARGTHFGATVAHGMFLYGLICGALSRQLEVPWFFDREYTPCEKKDRRIMVKQDLFYFTGANSAVLDDWKTGKRDGNEAKHARQIKRYVIAAFMRYPELEFVEGSARYLDKNDVFTRGYTREQAMAFFKTEENLLRRYFHDTKCMPKPNRINCKGCEYNKPDEDGNYQCEYGVRDL